MYASPDALPDPVLDRRFYQDVPTKRLLAWVVDSLIVLALCLVALPFTAFLGLFFFPLLWLCLSFVYRWFTLAGGSATWGMRLMAIEMRRADGETFDGATALMHTLIYSLSMAFFVAQIVSIVLMLTSARGQGLGDMMLGTVALNRRAL